MFSILSETNFNFLVTFIMLSAKTFNLDQSKILSFGKGLNLVWCFNYGSYISLTEFTSATYLLPVLCLGLFSDIPWSSAKFSWLFSQQP